MAPDRYSLLAVLTCASILAQASAQPTPAPQPEPAAAQPEPAAAQPAAAQAAPPQPATATQPAAPPLPPPAAAPAPAPAPELIAAPFDLHRPEIAQFVNDVVGHEEGWSRKAVVALISQAQPQSKILDIMSRPLERVAPWWEYRERFVTEERIDKGVQYWLDHRLALERFAAEYQVPPEYLVAIIGVETFYGRTTCRYRVLDALATLAFDYPPRASYFRGELEQFLLLSRENKLDPVTTCGSYAGAMGVPQFMPSVYRRYAVDADTNRKRDLWDSPDDILASVANYLHEWGWTPGAPVLAETSLDPDPSFQIEPHNLELNETVASLGAHGVKVDLEVPRDTPAVLISAEQRDGPAYRVGFHNFYVITRYNHSARYAMTVYDLAAAVAARVRGMQP
ncbi:MAG TPA: lytic murein transglycosylase B [Steroidobacteraceae bacterium]|nr:lytic murein transglycosylase B [Steroidobacteraceae bacterium]